MGGLRISSEHVSYRGVAMGVGGRFAQAGPTPRHGQDCQTGEENKKNINRRALVWPCQLGELIGGSRPSTASSPLLVKCGRRTKKKRKVRGCFFIGQNSREQVSESYQGGSIGRKGRGSKKGEWRCIRQYFTPNFLRRISLVEVSIRAYFGAELSPNTDAMEGWSG